MPRRILIALVVLLAVAGLRVLSVFIPVSGWLQVLEPRLVESCTALPVHSGTEDVAIDRSANRVYVSATDRRSVDRDSPNDGIYAFDIASPTSVVRVSPNDGLDFHPNGISLWRGDGETRLFATNSSSQREQSVEIFLVGDDGMLTYLESISFPEMNSPNDLVAVGPRAFYATNYRRYPSGVMSIIEQYFALPLASVVYFDGRAGRVITRGLVYANGINQSPDGKSIYIAEVLNRRVVVFDRELETGELTRRTSIELNTAPDNIDVDEDGNLWVAGHTKIFDYLAHAADAEAVAPSHVVQADHETGQVKDVFVSVSGEINGASVGAAHRGTLVIGAVLDGHVMVCPIDAG